MPVDLYVDYTMKKTTTTATFDFCDRRFFQKYHVSYNYLNMVMFWVDLLNMDSPNRAVAR